MLEVLKMFKQECLTLLILLGFGISRFFLGSTVSDVFLIVSGAFALAINLPIIIRGYVIHNKMKGGKKWHQ